MGRWIHQAVAAGLLAGMGLAEALTLGGCGMAAAPQPPSLHLPRQVADLKAERTGTTVVLNWVCPKQTTDKLKLTGLIQFRICRKQGASACQTIATTTCVPGKPASFTDQLNAALSAGPLREATYTVYGLNKKKRSAGPSNGAAALLGAAPPAISGLSANMTERGVVLRWQGLAKLPADTQVLLQRTLVLPPAAEKKSSATPTTGEPAEQELKVPKTAGNGDPGITLDSDVQFDRTYRYRASRTVTTQIDKQALQATSANSDMATIVTRDTFPPAAPVGLVAVPVSAAINNGKPEVDLSWSPNTEADLAQYRVYRQELGTQQNKPIQRIAPENDMEPLVGPAFRDTKVQAGKTYAYSVTAVDSSGNESAHSAEVRVTLPGP